MAMASLLNVKKVFLESVVRNELQQRQNGLTWYYLNYTVSQKKHPRYNLP